IKALLAGSALVVLAASVAVGQSLITSIKLDGNQIGLIKTGQGLSTRIAFAEPVKEIICGDLYDASTGRGSFVVQHGDNDVFIKPIPPKGMSNLFVKTGENGEHVYNFDVIIVPSNEASRVINVVSGFKAASGAAGSQRHMSPAEIQQDADKQAEQIIKDAHSQADRIVSDAKVKAEDLDTQSQERAADRVERDFISSILLGIREDRVDTKRIQIGKTSVVIDQPAMSFGGKVYLHYTILNDGKTDFMFSGLVLETGLDKTLPAKFTQSKTDNRVKPGESVTGVIAVERKLIPDGNKIMLSLRGQGHTELARVSVNL
ncbi:MAG: DivIVA domain-containing protein, partial [Blastocatellia bacterium]